MKLDLAQIKKFLSPHAYKDVDVFLRQMPERAGQTILIAGGVVWMIAAVGIVFATVEADKTAKLRADLFKQEALTPKVPQIINRPVSQEELSAFTKKANPQYPNVQVNTEQSKLVVSASDTRYYWVWREATGHIYNGGTGWRLSIDELCVGRECKGGQLKVKFSVNTLQVQAASSGG